MDGSQAQTQAWAEQTAWLAAGWLQVKVPLPFSLKWVNSYVVQEESGYTVIDPGLRTDEAIAVWEAVLAGHGIGWTEVTRVIVTHQHPDHYGLAGYFQQRSGAPVYLSRQAHRYTQGLWGGGDSFARELGELFARHGMPGEQLAAIAEHLDSFVAKVLPHPSVSYIEAGERLELGGYVWELIDAPGHAWGQLLLYDAQRGWMICGDQVLPRITPNISYIPGGEPDPLASFMDSLKRLGAYPVTFALPGHREPFTAFAARTGELRAHHERRLKQIRELLAEQALNAFALCELLFGRNLRDNAHNLRFAMSETLAHLIYLERRGLIGSSNDAAGIVIYS
jgi:glyoxylase-like metal-dependent hydrolase (beta-lactamase superfamily II)